MIIETPAATDFGASARRLRCLPTDQAWPASGPAGPRSNEYPARLPRRRRNRESDFQHAATVRESGETVRERLRIVVGMVVLFALMAVGTTAIGAGAAGRPPSVDQLSRPGSAPSTPAPEHVDLFGDSLGYQAEPYLDMFFAETHDYTLSDYTYGGTATCDWLSKMSAAAAKRPQAAVLVFSGNAFTPCMDGVTLRSLSYYDRYTTDTEQAIRTFSAVGAHVFLVGTPIDESSVAGWQHLDHIYRRLAQTNPVTVTYVEAGASVETATGGFTWTLPCLSIEPSCGPDGTNVVRSPDGIHFCPDGTPATRGVTRPCGEYSPGAFRFALVMVNAVTRYAYSTPR